MESFDGFEEAMKDAFYHDGKGKVILETTIEGFEIGVAVMGNKELFAISLASSNSFGLIRAMNCKGMTRVDMFVTPEDTIILNEVNTIPGFTDTSRYPTMMKEAGIPFPELIDKLVALAMEE